MNTFKKILLVSISILLMTAGLKLPSKAFVSCEKSKCIAKRKNIISPTTFLSIDETGDFNSSSGSGSDFDFDNQTNNLEGENNGNEPDAGTGGSDDEKACALNMAKLGIEKAFIACQIDTAIAKAEKIASIYRALHHSMLSLLNKMKRAPVCTGQGYNLIEFNRDHSILQNIKNLRDIIKQIKNLQNALSKISLDCDNCKDEAALNAALAEVAAINAQLNSLMNDFKNETGTIENRFNHFMARLQTVINIHSTTIPGIMAECGVNAVRARIMSRIRLRIIQEVNNLANYKNDLDQKIADIGFGTHTCAKAELDKFDLAAVACLSAL